MKKRIFTILTALALFFITLTPTFAFDLYGETWYVQRGDVVYECQNALEPGKAGPVESSQEICNVFAFAVPEDCNECMNVYADGPECEYICTGRGEKPSSFNWKPRNCNQCIRVYGEEGVCDLFCQ